MKLSLLACVCLTITKTLAAQSQEELEHRNDFIAFDLNHDGFVDASEVRQ